MEGLGSTHLPLPGADLRTERGLKRQALPTRFGRPPHLSESDDDRPDAPAVDLIGAEDQRYVPVFVKLHISK